MLRGIMGSFIFNINKIKEKRIKIKFYLEYFFKRSLKFFKKIDPVQCFPIHYFND